METYCMYLRKSRADAEAERRGEGETLARHERTLLELAAGKRLTVVKVYREIVSGDSIAARPQMQAMLADIADRKYTGVLCMEIERLARGNTIDQGVVAQAFKDSGTLIVTPSKTYNPSDEFDEEYFEFSLFMSRREYKTINRRMQAGRLAAIKEGNYISPEPPYGYRKIHPEPKLHTLEIVPEEAETVRLIYELYLSGKGARAIVTELNHRKIPPRRNLLWEVPSIRKILKNPVYTGVLQWHTKENQDICYAGKHEAIIRPEQFQAVQKKRLSVPEPTVSHQQEFRNHYHHILYCGECGHQMGRRMAKSSGKAHMLCRYRQCTGKTVSASVQSIDEAVFTAIRRHIEELKYLEYIPEPAPEQKPETIRPRLEQKLEQLQKQQNKLYDFLEQEIYDINTFSERMQILDEKKKALEEQLSVCRKEEAAGRRPPEESILQLEYVLSHFEQSDSHEKNNLLHTIIERIDYFKTRRGCYRKSGADLKLEIRFL